MFDNRNIVIIANPDSQLGHAKEVSLQVEDMLVKRFGEERITLTFAKGFRDVSRAVEDLPSSVGSVIGLGGDGILHAIAQGLMKIDEVNRPVFGVIPVGNGNDYARSLGMSTDHRVAVSQLINYPALKTDIGLVNNEYFLETLSFGIDAAIGLGTERRRVETGHSGTRLYLEEGIDQMLHHLKRRATKAILEDGCKVDYQGKKIHSESVKVDLINKHTFLFAVQIGPTYGGGFNIAPEAIVDDGIFDIVLATDPLTPIKATKIFLKAKNGKHTKFKQLEFYRASSLHLFVDCDDDDELPIQADGEKIEGKEFDIRIKHRALSVIRKKM